MGMHQNEMSLDLDALSWVDVAAQIARDPRLIMPVGALDQHGAHLPLGANVLIARRVALDLSREFRVLRAPTFHYGTNPPVGRHYAGTASISPKTLQLALNELVARWEECGIGEFIFITAHRYEPHTEAIAALLPRRARIRVVQIWDTPIDDLLERQGEPLHADEAETSLMLHLYPELVEMDRSHDLEIDPKLFQCYLEGRLTKPLVDGAGTIGTPSAATAEKGERIYRRILRVIGDAIFRPPPGREPDST